jgi:hypothetical protein
MYIVIVITGNFAHEQEPLIFMNIHVIFQIIYNFLRHYVITFVLPSVCNNDLSSRLKGVNFCWWLRIS